MTFRSTPLRSNPHDDPSQAAPFQADEPTQPSSVRSDNPDCSCSHLVTDHPALPTGGGDYTAACTQCSCDDYDGIGLEWNAASR